MTLSISDHPLAETLEWAPAAHHPIAPTPKQRSAGTVVIKLGGHALTNEHACTLAAAAILRHRRRGNRVVAVVSALWGQTDRLVAAADAVGAPADDPARAELLATAEQAAATLLGLALNRAGINNRVLHWTDTGITASARQLNAEPHNVDTSHIEHALEHAGVAILPGFVAPHSTDGRAALLGQGGSDLTALLIAGKLGADAILFKHDDGVRNDHNTRYATISWHDASAAAARTVAPAALRLAETRRIPFTVSTLNADHSTAVGPFPTRLAAADPPADRTRVAFLGAGETRDIITHRLNRDPERFAVAHTFNPADPPDVLVDVSTSVAALPSIKNALALGIDVITANPAALEGSLEQLQLLADSTGATLHATAAVGGAAPMLELVTALAADDHDPITAIRGTLDAAPNAVLDALAHSESLEQGVRNAQHANLATRELTAQLDGLTSARALALLATAAFDETIHTGHIHRRGIQTVEPTHVADAHAAGSTVRLVATAHRTAAGINLTVEPQRLDPSDPLADAPPTARTLELTLHSGATHVVSAIDTGPHAQAEALLADLADAASAQRHTEAHTEANTVPEPQAACA